MRYHLGGDRSILLRYGTEGRGLHHERLYHRKRKIANAGKTVRKDCLKRSKIGESIGEISVIGRDAVHREGHEQASANQQVP